MLARAIQGKKVPWNAIDNTEIKNTKWNKSQSSLTPLSIAIIAKTIDGSNIEKRIKIIAKGNSIPTFNFYNCTQDDVISINDEFNPLDKAGSYGIQELPDGILDKYEGSFDNIVGLAPEAVTAVLEKLK